MIENKLVKISPNGKYCGVSLWTRNEESIGRIIASWTNIAGPVFGPTFDDWLIELGISDDDKKMIHDYIQQAGLVGNLELEEHAKRWLKDTIFDEINK